MRLPESVVTCESGGQVGRSILCGFNGCREIRRVWWRPSTWSLPWPRCGIRSEIFAARAPSGTYYVCQQSSAGMGHSQMTKQQFAEFLSDGLALLGAEVPDVNP